MKSDFERAAAFEERLRDAAAERLVPSPLGTAVFNDTLARVWSLNTLRVEISTASADDIVSEAERLQGAADLSHRRVMLTDEEAGGALEDAFNAMGWKTDAFVFMVPKREPNRSIDTSLVQEVQEQDIEPLRDTILREWLTDADDDVIAQIHGADRLVTQAGNARHFAVLIDGVAVSSTDLYSDGRTAQVEDVMTLPEHRGKGFASAVVMRALEEARATDHEFVFLIADARDWPKELYSRLGFDPVGERYAYLKAPVT